MQHHELRSNLTGTDSAWFIAVSAKIELLAMLILLAKSSLSSKQ